MERKKERESWAGQIVAVLANGYTFIMLLVFPLFYRDKLYDIFQAKRDFFLLAVMVFLTASGLFLLFDRTERTGEERRKRTIQTGGKIVLCSGAVLCVSALFTVLVNQNRGDIFWGTDVTRIGSATLLFGVSAAFVAGRYLRWNHVLTWAFLLGSGGVFLLQVLNERRIDPLGMYETMLEEQIPGFMSTIGNINFNASYDAAVMPVLMALFVTCREKISERVYGAFLFLVFCGMICCRSDSILLAFSVVFFVLFEFVLKDREGMRKCMDVLLIFLGSSSLIGILYHVFPEKANPIGGLARLFINRSVMGAELSAFAVLFFIRWKGMSFFTEERVKGVRLLFHAVPGILLLLFAAAFFRAGMLGEDAVRGTVLEYFSFSDRWGSSRGYIWRRACDLYRNYPLPQKLFGCGPDNLPAFLDASYGEEMQLFMGNYRFKDCHNELLQILVSFGAVGAAGYFGMIFSVLALCIRNFPKRGAALVGILGLSGYLAQGMVNSPTIAVVPMLFLELGILCRGLVFFDEAQPGSGL